MAWAYKEADYINRDQKIKFSTWLTNQCKVGGWEVVKISKDFQTGNVWCVFKAQRKK